jgi:hypothetical protein
MRRVILVLALALGCRGSSEEGTPSSPIADAGPMQLPGNAECPATHVADGPACAPKFDACGEREIAKLGGGCEPVGIATCGEGFTADGRGGCKTTLPTAPCAAGSIALPGMAACEPIAACADVEGTVFVDATATGGDGSRAKPFAKIGEAIVKAVDGDIVAIAPGTYEEDVKIDKAIRVVGRCPTMVTIKGVASDGTAVTIAAKASIERVAITGPGAGVTVAGVNGTVDSLRVFSLGAEGVVFRIGASGVVRRTVVQEATTFGVLVSGSTARVERVHVVGTKFGSASVGVRVNPNPTTFAPAELTMVGSLVEKNPDINVQALSSKMTIESSVIRDGVPYMGEWGIGLASSNHPSIKVPGDLTVRTSIVENNFYMGILARDSKLILDRTVVRDTKVEEKKKNYGRGVVVQGVTSAASLDMKDSVVERNQETGVDVNGQAVAKISGSIIRDTQPNVDNGTGMFLELINKTGPVPEATIDRTLFSGNAKAGVISAGKADISASRFSKNKTFSLVSRGDVTIKTSVVEDCDSDAMGRDGHGLLAIPDMNRSRDPLLIMEDVAVRRVRKAGVSMFGGKLTMNRCWVRDVGNEKVDPIGGIAVAVEAERPSDTTSLDLRASLLEGVQGAGVLVNGAPAKIDAVHVRGVTLAVNGAFGDGVFAAGMFFVPGGLRPASVELTGSWIEKAERTSVAIFGGTFHMNGTHLTCSPIALNVETLAAFNGTDYVEGELSIEDRGGNTCGCEQTVACTARSTNLKPAQPTNKPTL